MGEDACMLRGGRPSTVLLTRKCGSNTCISGSGGVSGWLTIDGRLTAVWMVRCGSWTGYVSNDRRLFAAWSNRCLYGLVPGLHGLVPGLPVYVPYRSLAAHVPT